MGKLRNDKKAFDWKVLQVLRGAAVTAVIVSWLYERYDMT